MSWILSSKLLAPLILWKQDCSCGRLSQQNVCLSTSQAFKVVLMVHLMCQPTFCMLVSYKRSSQEDLKRSEPFVITEAYVMNWSFLGTLLVKRLWQPAYPTVSQSTKEGHPTHSKPISVPFVPFSSKTYTSHTWTMQFCMMRDVQRVYSFY